MNVLMTPKTKLFIILWTAGFAGILSFLLVDVNAMLDAMFSHMKHEMDIPHFTLAMHVLSLIQPSVLLALAVFGGVALASKVGLRSPAAEAAANGESFWAALKPQIIPGILGGIAGGIAIVLIAAMAKLFLPPDVVAKISELGKFMPIPTRLLYGGVTEELLFRWGLMTLLVWIVWRAFQNGQNTPKPFYFIGAIFISAVVFGIGHLPIAFLIVPEPTLALITFVITANSAFGLVAGWLYWKKGLESAIIAHMFAHVTMLTASSFGAYF